MRIYQVPAAAGLCVCLLASVSSLRAEETARTTSSAGENVASAVTGDTSDLYESTSADPSDFGFLEQQIFRAEAAEAQDHLETMVQQIEATHHRYHEELVVPLTLLGDAAMVQRDYDQALQQYGRARHLARVNYGLFDARQLAIVYREADAYKKIGDLANAGQREEYAYEVLLKSFPEYDPRVVPALMRLGKFYLETYNFLAARTLFGRAMTVHSSNNTDYSLAAVPVLQGIALSHRLERFPPYYVATSSDNQRLQGPTPGLTTTDLDNQHVAFNNFPAGEKALQQIVEIRRRQEPPDHEATMEAIIDLADWHLMFGRNNTANTLYSHVFEQMLKQGSDPAAYFGEPKLIYLPKPSDPEPPDVSSQIQPSLGVVELEFDVSPTGRVRKLKTTESQPPKLMDFRVRRSMRLAVFRPKLVEGVPVTAERHSYRHEFEYFPTPDDIQMTDDTAPETTEEESEVSES